MNDNQLYVRTLSNKTVCFFTTAFSQTLRHLDRMKTITCHVCKTYGIERMQEIEWVSIFGQGTNLPHVTLPPQSQP